MTKSDFCWNRLRAVQSNKIVNSTYIWLVLVPITAKIFSKLENELILNINNKNYIFDLTLPFSWQIFFFSALFFVLGNVMFLLFSPRIIKDYKDYGHFLQVGGTDSDLLSYRDKALEKRAKATEDLKKLSGIYEKRSGVINKQNDNEESTIRRELFWEIYRHFNNISRFAIFFCYALYIVGFLLFFYVACTNIYWVFGQLTVI